MLDILNTGEKELYPKCTFEQVFWSRVTDKVQ